MKLQINHPDRRGSCLNTHGTISQLFLKINFVNHARANTHTHTQCTLYEWEVQYAEQLEEIYCIHESRS